MNNEPEIDLPLRGLRVLDFGQYIAGPLAAKLLAEQGAEVVRVEMPDGPRGSRQTYELLNRGKKSIVLDLKKEADLKIAHDLAASSDVVIENFRPGVMKRLSCDYALLAALNPRLIYLSLPAFARHDPRASIQGWEGVVNAATGWFTDVSLTREFRGDPPVYTAIPLASANAAVHGATAIAMALFAREKDGAGEEIEVPLTAAILSSQGFNTLRIEDMPARYTDMAFGGISKEDAKQDPRPFKERIEPFINPLYTDYLCKDGRLYYVDSDGHRRLPVQFLETMGIWDELVEMGLPMEDPYIPSATWQSKSNIWDTNALEPEWRTLILEKLRKIFLTKTAEEWETAIGDAGGSGTAQRTTKEWVDSEHALAAGLVRIAEENPSRKIAGPHVWLKETAAKVGALAKAPNPDEDRQEILSLIQSPSETSTGVSSSAKNSLNRKILDGIRVLDLCNVLAGPSIGFSLARFGAEVIKIDPPESQFPPTITILCAIDVGRGKKSLLLDLQHEAGKKVFEELVKSADVVTYNGPLEAVSRLGLGREALNKINPNLIFCHVSAYCGPYVGPRSNHTGYDDVLQAATGVMARYGESVNDPEIHANAATIDYPTGYLAVYGIALALIQRHKTGRTDTVMSSLAGGAQLVQAPFILSDENLENEPEPHGRHCRGEGPHYRIYETADGWVFFGCKPEQLTEVHRVPGFEGTRNVPEEKLEHELEQCFCRRNTSSLIEDLTDANFGAQALQTLSEIRENYLGPDDIDNIDFDEPTIRFVRHSKHPLGRNVDLPAPNWMRFRNSTLSVGCDAPKFGANSREILVSLGYSNEAIEKLLEDGAVATSWSNTREYLPS